MDSKSQKSLNAEELGFKLLEIDNFIAGRKCPCDLYIKLSDEKFIKIMNKNDDFSRDTLNNWINKKNLKYLYVRKEDYKKYRDLTSKLPQVLAKKGNAKQYTNITKNICEQIIRDINTEGIKSHLLHQSTDMINSCYEMIEHDSNIIKLLVNNTDLPHNFSVVLYTILIVDQFDWPSLQVRENIAMAAMLHDIGKSKLSDSIRDLKYEELNTSQKKDFEKHPQYSCDIISQSRYVNDLIMQVVAQHHEYANGTGYPRKLAGGRITIPSSILSFANFFTDYVHLNKKNPKEALIQILNAGGIIKKFNSKVVQSFTKCFEGHTDDEENN